MTLAATTLQAFQRVFNEDLRQPRYLTPDEVRGDWCDLFPDLASALPPPYPIFGVDEERVLTYGYPILISDGVWRLRRELEKLVSEEAEYRLQGGALAVDKEGVMAQRERYTRALATIFENVFMNDYGRGLLEVFLLFHSGDVVRCLNQAERAAHRQRTASDPATMEETRQAIAGVAADLLQRASTAATERLKQLAEGPTVLSVSPLLTLVCQDQLLLTESHPPADLAQIAGYIRVRLRQDPTSLIRVCEQVLRRLQELVRRHPEMGSLLSTAGAGRLRLDQTKTLLEPRLLDALSAANLIASLELAPAQVRVLRELGLRLKAFELLATLRRRIRAMERRGSELVLAGGATAVAPSTRPFDFAAPGVVESLVRRCGLVYDLTNFTAVLEAVRKRGHAAEEKALQFMYIFQNRLEDIRRRRVLNFEKFLGDGALYSSRRATRVLAAACEIQRLYDHLRHSGFPFDKGIRFALNFGTYRLLPMLNRSDEPLRFEFFGHGIVELARLTTGKSTREVEEIAEFLIHAGYNTASVEHFLAPLMAARSGHQPGGRRSYTASIDNRGELINEGMVLTLPFLAELEKELNTSEYGVIDFDDLRWAVLPVDSRDPDSLFVGLRYLGVARLKGLSPQELVEATVWEQLPTKGLDSRRPTSLIDLLRQLAQEAEAGDEPPAGHTISDDLLVVSYVQAEGARRWIFGEYRPSDDVVLHAVPMAIRAPDLGPDDALETWLFRNRFDLAKLYDGVRRDNAGVSTPLTALRGRPGFVACFLAAPHRAPGE